MKNLTLILLLTTIGACGKLIPQTPVSGGVRGNIDPEVKPYYDSFVRKSACFQSRPALSNLTIKLVPKIPTADGTGYMAAFCDVTQAQVISVSRMFWDTATEAQKERLIYHEMGHCTLGLKHVEDRNAIMSYSVFTTTDQEYERNYETLIETMYSEVSSCEFEFDPTIYKSV